MPLRRIRDGLVTSSPFNALTWREQSFFVRLMLTADDYGCYHADPVILRAHLYPRLLDRVSTADVASMLAACEQAGLVSTYDADGQKYLLVHKFKQAIRAARKYPEPPPELSPASHLRRKCDTHAPHPRPDNNNTPIPPDTTSHAKQKSSACSPTPPPPSPTATRKPTLSPLTDQQKNWLATMCSTRPLLAQMASLPPDILSAALSAAAAMPDAPKYAPQLTRYYAAKNKDAPYPPYYRPTSYAKMFRDLPDIIDWALKWCARQDAAEYSRQKSLAAAAAAAAAEKAAAQQDTPLTREENLAFFQQLKNNLNHGTT